MQVINELSKTISKELTSEAVVVAFNLTKSASAFYPDYDTWFWGSVATDIAMTDERKIIFEYSGLAAAGVAIIKNTQFEKKLCNLTVHTSYQNKGYGLKLFEKSFEALGTDKPFLTVSEEKYLEFERLFKHYGFKVTSVHDALYRPGKVEYFLNEDVSKIM